ncbi:MAG: NfeD family protein [Salibacter sp.]|uniref:NfeD family protein n=1 Tax=Salibacter sp. TaxID=2010995 RepID=UPI002870A9E2|nr:NfeD family protein [Salibacter sp.]MDR9397885.1 NfeD family protein [Salibacter sp.]
MRNIFLFSVFFLSLFTVRAEQADTATRVYIFDIHEAIAPPSWRITQEAFKEADEWGADIIFLNLNTYGGQVDMADSIRTKILNSPKPVYVLVENNAASAGALISIACDKIFMQPGSTIGAATVVDQSGKPVPDKYQSYMRNKMRATAEETGRDPDMAEAMVDPDKYVKGVSDSGKVLTFTTSAAIENGFCEAEMRTIPNALRHLKITNFETKKYKPTTIDKIIGWLINPAISGVLILLIIGGIYFELQSPGLGFPILASIGAALLFFAPYYLEGLAANWEILLFVVGLVLLALEIFVIPGFGVAGIAGIICIVGGLVFSMIGNIGFDFSGVSPDNFLGSLATVLVAITASLMFALFFGARLLNTGPLKKIVLSSTQQKSEGYVSNKNVNATLTGKTGTTFTELRPGGKVKIDNEYYDAFSIEGYLAEGSDIEVVSTQGAQVRVRAK